MTEPVNHPFTVRHEYRIQHIPRVMLGSYTLFSFLIALLNIIASVYANGREISVWSEIDDKRDLTTPCLQTVALAGSGVKDVFREPCEGKKSQPFWYSYGGTRIWGDPSIHTFSLYQDRSSQVIVIRSGVCSLFGYNTYEGGEITKFPGTITPDLCEDIKKIMRNINLMKAGKVTVKDNRLMVYVKERTKIDGTCSMRSHAVGRGVQFLFQEPCVQGQIVTIIRDDLTLYGDLTHFSFFLFSDTWNTLTVIRYDECKNLEYKTVKRKTTLQPASPPMSPQACTDLKKRILTIWENELAPWLNLNREITAPRLDTSSLTKLFRTTNPHDKKYSTRLYRYLRRTRLVRQVVDAFVW